MIKEHSSIIIRLYDANGTHKLSLCPCDVDENGVVNYDVATPEGQVWYCGVAEDLVYCLAQHLGFSRYYPPVETDDTPHLNMPECSCHVCEMSR